MVKASSSFKFHKLQRGYINFFICAADRVSQLLSVQKVAVDCRLRQSTAVSARRQSLTILSFTIIENAKD